MAGQLSRLPRFFAPRNYQAHRLQWGENMTIDEFLSNVRRIQASDPRYRLGRDGSDGYCDCIGLVIGAIRRSGGRWTGIHGTNWTARNAMQSLLPLQSAGQLRRGELVFRAHEPGDKGYALPSRYAGDSNRRDYYHVGVVMQTSPLRILHCSGGGVQTDTSTKRWQFHGMLRMLVPRTALLQSGDTGDAVRAMQTALMAAGFPLPLHGADGEFGAETEQALRRFQQRHGLPETGTADTITLDALNLLNG